MKLCRSTATVNLEISSIDIFCFDFLFPFQGGVAFVCCKFQFVAASLSRQPKVRLKPFSYKSTRTPQISFCSDEWILNKVDKPLLLGHWGFWSVKKKKPSFALLHLMRKHRTSRCRQAGKGSWWKGGSRFVVSQNDLRLEMPKTGAISPFYYDLFTKYKPSKYYSLYAKQPICTQYAFNDASQLGGSFYSNWKTCHV